MKKVIYLIVFAISIANSFAQDSKESKEKEALTYEAKHKGITHIVSPGDTVLFGYGSKPYGDFMYINNGPTSLDKQFAGKTGKVVKVKYAKSLSQYQLYIKGKFGFYIVDVPQAIDKGEVVGFNSERFDGN